jgi:UDPglucose 6-dehydrogenase
MKVSVIGTGYVGLVTGTCFAEMGHTVTCIDIDPKKIAMLQQGKSPIYEPGLQELIARNIHARRLNFSTTYDSIQQAKTIFLAVGTPSADDGRADLRYLKEASIQLAKDLQAGSIVVIKSTVPVGTNTIVKDLITKHCKHKFYVVNNPEFLKEGTAVEDFMRPDRVVIGHDEIEAAEVMEELYAPLVRQGNPIYRMSNLSAEMTKYAANCFLATKISFINEIARLCDVTGADIEEVRKGITSDQRIGKHFLYAGPGYGGSCFPKDVKALMATAEDHGMNLSIVDAADQVNNTQKTYIFEKIKKHFSGNLKGKTFCLWGVAFKPNTDDIREAPAIDICRELIREGAKVNFFDPIAADNFLSWMENKENSHGQVISYEDKYEALEGCSGFIIMTEWKEFRFPDFDLVKEKIKDRVVFDARNIYTPNKIVEQGFAYYGIGKRADNK